MLSRDQGQIFFECDGKRCAEILETNTLDFKQAREELAAANWAIRKIKDEWVHICPDCQEAETGGLVL